MKRKKVLFVCTGNTCRSPMAEIIFRAEIKKRKIKYVDAASAGIFAQNSTAINPLSAACLREMGLDHSKFKPRQLKHKMIESSYITVCMTEGQKELLNCFENVRSMREIVGFDIPGPYGRGEEAYRYTARALCVAVDAIIRRYFADAPTGRTPKK